MTTPNSEQPGRLKLRLVADAAGLAWRSSPAMALSQAILAVVGGLLPVAVGLLTKYVLEELTVPGQGRARVLVSLALALAAGGIATALLPHLTGYVTNEWSRATVLRARGDLYRAVNRLIGLGRLEDPTFRDRLRLAQESGQSSPSAVASGGLELVRAAITITGFLGALVALNPWLVLIVAVVGVPTAYAELKLSRRRADLMWQLSPGMRREIFYTELLTGLPAAKEIRLFGLAGLFHRRMLTELSQVNAGNRRMDRQQVRTQLVLGLIGAAVAGVGLLWAIQGAAAGRLTVGDVAIFIAAVAGVQGAVANAISQYAQAHNALLMFVHYQDMVHADPDLPMLGDAPAAPLRRGIELRDVWFRYSDEHPWVLRGVNLTIPHGAAVALVGLNGAGKSTLVKLLARFYDPVRGTILWDGADLRELDVATLRARIGAVFQDFMSYDLSAAENIGLGDLSALDDQDRLVTAARNAGAHDMVAALPRGYATQLTRMFLDEADKNDPSTGVLLSGGQWQRLALARSFLRAEQDLLILDEPSSGLDAEAEADIQQRLRDLRQGRTTLLISHRLGTLREADIIVVIADGVVVEQGGHDELLDRNGAYARLFRLQASGYTDRRVENGQAPEGSREPEGSALR